MKDIHAYRVPGGKEYNRHINEAVDELQTGVSTLYLVNRPQIHIHTHNTYQHICSHTHACT